MRLRVSGVGLVWKPQMDAARHGQRAVKFGAGRGTRKHTHLKLLPVDVRFGDAPRQLDWNHLGVSRAGESAHADLIAGANQ